MILEIQIGSRAYGANLADSDNDILRIDLPHYKELFGGIPGFNAPNYNHIRQTQGEQDITCYSLPKFFRDAADGTPKLISALYYPVLNSTYLGDCLRNMRHHFLSEKIRKKYICYAKSQLGSGTQKGLYHGVRLSYELFDLLGTGRFSVRDFEDDLKLIRLTGNQKTLAIYRDMAETRLEICASMKAVLREEVDEHYLSEHLSNMIDRYYYLNPDKRR